MRAQPTTRTINSVILLKFTASTMRSGLQLAPTRIRSLTPSFLFVARFLGRRKSYPNNLIGRLIHERIKRRKVQVNRLETYTRYALALEACRGAFQSELHVYCNVYDRVRALDDNGELLMRGDLHLLHSLRCCDRFLSLAAPFPTSSPRCNEFVAVNRERFMRSN